MIRIYFGEVSEWFKEAVSKTVVREFPVPWVRIPPSPPNAKSFATAELFFCFAFKMDKTDSIGLKDTFLVVNIECDFLQVISFPPFR
jgi:hypothetical protein